WAAGYPTFVGCLPLSGDEQVMRRALSLYAVLGGIALASLVPDLGAQATRPAPPLLAALANGSSVYDLAFSPDGELLAAGGFDGSLRIWDIRSRKPLLTIQAHDDTTTSVAFHPRQRIVATTGK